MTDLSQALTRFWSGFTDGGRALPAYLEGHVPPRATFPYLVYTLARPEALEEAVLYADCWCQSGQGRSGNEQRARILSQLADALPVGGRALALEDGFALLYRSREFQTLLTGANGACGGRTAYRIRYYGF